mgnify:FL=1
MGANNVLAILLLCLVIGACTRIAPPGSARPVAVDEASEMKLEFLTRDGCKNTPTMLANVEQALASIGSPHELNIVHQAALSPDDPRTGYPTPTILVNGLDIFGLPVPEPPFPAPA